MLTKYGDGKRKKYVSLSIMGRLIDEITGFLEDSGVGCSRRMYHSLEVICAKTTGTDSLRLILPLEINASSQEEAHVRNSVTEEAIRLMKSQEGYPLIITEDRWRSQGMMMRARLLAHLEIFSHIFARNCMVRKMEKTEAQAFLGETHSYGYATCRYRYGLFTKSSGALVAVATFSNARKWIKDGKEIRSYEWTRYASLPGVRICGGMGKLLKAFIAEVRPDDIMSYADLEWSEGEVYRTLGFIGEPGKGPVDFTVNPETWERKAIMPHEVHPPGELHFRNFGSAKYRLKLTEY